jgi:hypothetical protein
VLADGPVLEICTGPAIAGMPIAPASSQVLATDPVTVT